MILDFSKAFDTVPTDGIILDFSKAFDTVPHDSFLHKLEICGVMGSLLDLARSVLCDRYMKVVERESSREESVLPGSTRQ